MKIYNITKDVTYYVEIEEEEGEDFDFHHYRTDENGNHWEIAMGDSWETVFKDDELREKFLQFKRDME